MNRSLYRLCFRSLLFQIKTPSSSSSSSSGFLPAFLPSRHGLHSSWNPLQQAAAAERLPEEELPDDDFIPELGRRPCLKVKRLADEMVSLSVLEISDVGDLLRKRLRISGTMMMTSIGSAPLAGPGPGGPQDEKKAEKTSFDIKIEKYDPAAKIKVIKEVRAITALGLKEAKELVEKVPAVVKTGLTKAEAEEMVAKLKTAGAIVVLE